MKKMLNVSKKGKWIIGGIMGFTVIATASTGLAAWVIGQQTPDTGNGSITVATVSDQSCTVTLDEAADLTINFGPKAGTYSIVNATDTAVSEEDLDFTIKGTLTHDSGTYSTVSVKMVVSTAVASAITSSYIVLPTEFTAVSEEENTYSCSINVADKAFEKEFVFAWGTAFGSKNPCEYYDGTTGKGYSEAKTALTALQALNEETFDLTVSPVLG